MRLMPESLEIFNQYSLWLGRRGDGAILYVSITQIYVDSFKDVMENKK
jgi:hypothetical protein